VSLRSFRQVLGGDLAGKAFTALFLLALIRYLAPQDLALFLTLHAVVILSVTLPAGIINRHYLVTDGAEAAAGIYQRLQIIAAGLCAALFVALAVRHAPWHAWMSTAACALAGARFEFGRTHAQRRGDFSRWARAEVLRAAMLMPALAWMMSPPGSGWIVSALLLSMAIGYTVADRLIDRPEPGSMPHGTVTVAFGDGKMALIALHSGLVAISGQLPVLLVANMGDAADTASFGSAFRYYGLLLAFVVSANVVVLSKVASGSPDLYAVVRSLQIRGTFVLVTLMAVGYLLIPLADGGRYPQAPGLFVILALALVPGLFSAPLVALALKGGRLGLLVSSQLLSLAAMLAVVALLWQTPVRGAALGVPLACVAQWLLLKVRLNRRPGEESAR
jgi:hypothetical protein